MVSLGAHGDHTRQAVLITTAVSDLSQHDADHVPRKGFDLARHPISLLSLGAPGWVQIANFVVCGILYVLGAVGLRQAIRQSRGGTWDPLLIGITGVGLIIAGVFTADPGAGFPPGAPSGNQQ